MRRRSFLAGGLAAISGCSTPVPFDEAEIRASYPPIGEFVEVWGLRVHYWERGAGVPVVLVHGASGNLRDWTFSIAPKLAEHFRVIAVDRPGFGYSDRPSVNGWDPEVQARVLQAAMTKIGADKPIVVGHSWGGALAMAWALAFPRQTLGVVPVSAVTMPYGGMATIVRAIGLDSVIIDAYTSRLLERAREGGIRDFIARVFRPQRVPSGYLEYVGAPLALREKTLRANGADLQNVNIALRRMSPNYREVKLPVELVHGMADFIDWDDHADPLTRLLPNANLTLLPGVGHMAHHAAPEELKRAISRVASHA
ncbi:MAG: alpha/beta fold hydrolase [Pikeienuella sp.]